MGLLDAPRAAPANPEIAQAQAQRQLDALVVKQMLQASGAFKASAAAGASLHSDLFVEALAEAVSQSANLAIARLPAAPPAVAGDKSITKGPPRLAMPAAATTLAHPGLPPPALPALKAYAKRADDLGEGQSLRGRQP